MLPLHDSVRHKKAPVITWLIMAACALVFLYEITLRPGDLQWFFSEWGMAPAQLHFFIPSVLIAHPWELFRLVTAIFLHNGWVHFLSNMLILFVFGASVEERMGYVRYALFFILGGIAANLIHAAFYPFSSNPVVGASGAIASVLGAYFLFYPAARVLTLIPLFLIPWIVEVPAFFYLGIWFITQMYSGFLSLRLPPGAQMNGIAWWAHVGGFLAGLFFARYYSLHHKPAISPWYPESQPSDKAG
jgi:membrane associated rhomboid family serine protease